MWDPYIRGVKSALIDPLETKGPKIVHDKFHLLDYANKYVDKVRKKECKELSKQGNDILKGQKYIFLKNANRLKPQELEFINKINLKTSKAWYIKEDFKKLLKQNSKQEALDYFNQWKEKSLIKDDSKYLKSFINTITNHLDNILNYFDYKITNAISKGF